MLLSAFLSPLLLSLPLTYYTKFTIKQQPSIWISVRQKHLDILLHLQLYQSPLTLKKALNTFPSHNPLSLHQLLYLCQPSLTVHSSPKPANLYTDTQVRQSLPPPSSLCLSSWPCIPQCLPLSPQWWGFVAGDVGTLGDVPLSHVLGELAITMRTLHIV